MKKYDVTPNVGISGNVTGYTIREDNSPAQPDVVTPFLLKIYIMYLLIPFSFILYFVTKRMMEKPKRSMSEKEWKNLKLANKVTKYVFMFQVYIVIAGCIFGGVVLAHLLGFINIPFLDVLSF